MDIKAVIFDMDGVVLDTETICFKTWELAARDFTIADYEKAEHACLGTNKKETENILKNFFGDDFDAKAFMERTSHYFYEIERAQGISLMKEVIPTLEYLSGKYKIALASSTREVVVRRQLTNAGVIKYFQTITCGDQVTKSKPDPEIYLKACASIGIVPQNACAVEDSPNGIRSAFSAGLKPIMVPDKIMPDWEMKEKCFKIVEHLGLLKDFL